jgi:proprotein convertase subtilisin/kexin type 5
MEERRCKVCDPSCKTCYAGSGSSVGECSVCNSDYDCNHGQTCCAALGRCVYAETVCDGDEVVLTGHKNCDSCFEGMFLNKAVCGPHCPPGTWADCVDRECKLCDNHCNQCTGPAYNECSSCHHGMFLHITECLNTCPNGFYANHSTGHCELCNGACYTCSGPAYNHCTSCRDNHFLFEMGAA